MKLQVVKDDFKISENNNYKIFMKDGEIVLVSPAKMKKIAVVLNDPQVSFVSLGEGIYNKFEIRNIAKGDLTLNQNIENEFHEN